MMAAEKRPLWLVTAPLPATIVIDLWISEARGLGFTDIEAGHLAFWRWLAHIDPARVTRWERTEEHG